MGNSKLCVPLYLDLDSVDDVIACACCPQHTLDNGLNTNKSLNVFIRSTFDPLMQVLVVVLAEARIARQMKNLDSSRSLQKGTHLVNYLLIETRTSEVHMLNRATVLDDLTKLVDYFLLVALRVVIDIIFHTILPPPWVSFVLCLVDFGFHDVVPSQVETCETSVFL